MTMLRAGGGRVDLDVKKLLRSMLVFAPGVQDLRYRAEAGVLRALRQPFRAEFAGLRALPGDDPLVVDIGCNRGVSISTVLAMKPRARVIGFEANPQLAAATKGQFARDANVEVRSFGLGRERSEHTLYVPVYRGYRMDGLGSFDEGMARALFDGRWLYWYDPRHLVIEKFDVVVRPLDEFQLEPLVIKLYVQGHEVAVIEGASRTMEASEPIVIAPSRHWQVDAAMRARGYGRYQWQKGRFVAEADSGYVVYYMTPKRARDIGV